MTYICQPKSLSQNNIIILIANYGKGYDSHKPITVDKNEIIYTYNLLKKKGGGARIQYKNFSILHIKKN